MRIMSFFCFLFFLSSSHAFTFTTDFQKGFYWQSFPVRMVIQGTDHTGFLSAVSDMAMKTWEDTSVVGNNIWDISNIAQVNTIQWSSDPNDFQGLDMNSTLAIAVRYNQVPYVVKAQIFLNKTHVAFNFGNIKLNLYKVLVHELGHTLGLDHNAVISDSIMAPSLSSINHFCSLNSFNSCLLNYLDQDDVNGASSAYQGHIGRQQTGYTFALESQSSIVEKNAAACGTVDLGSDDDQGQGPRNFMLSLFFGLLISLSMSKRKVLLLSRR